MASARLFCVVARRCSSTSSSPPTAKLVFGAGSNVLDVFFPVRQLPKPGDKQYFALESLTSASVVGGVTLNHLAWARELGVPTALLALQGEDETGATLRAKMRSMGVDASFVRASREYTTSVSYILSEEGGGERTILMNPASTSRMDGALMAREWAAAVKSRAAMVTTEISQLPLSGVEWLLDAGRAARVPTVLDVDVPPSVATGAARLGTADALRRCVTKSDVVKLTGSAVEELLALIAPGSRVEASLEAVTQQLADALGAPLVVITDGSKGAALAVARARGGRGTAVRVPAFTGVTQKDATGAGDAYLGGLIAAIYARGLRTPLPVVADDLIVLGRIAGAAGAACVEVLGALPVEAVSAARMAALCTDAAPLVRAAAAITLKQAAPPPSVPLLTAPVAFATSLASDAAALASLAAAPEAAASAGAIDAFVSATANGGIVWTTGVGKAGAVAARAAQSFRSVGVRAAFITGAEWAHGDLGGLRAGDTVLAFSHSGRSPELIAVAGAWAARGATTFAITGDGTSPLARAAAHSFTAPAPTELLGSVPTRSVAAQEAVVNALLSTVVASSGLTEKAFRVNHPGGAIGRAA